MARNFSPLERALAGVTIAELGARFFPSWRPGKSCPSPFREDKKPSFSVFADGRKWKDHATAEGGDAVDFLAKARGIALPAACRDLIYSAGGGAALPGTGIASTRRQEVPPCPRPAVEERPASSYLWSEIQATMRRGRICEFESLARLRGLPVFAGLQLASDAGQLWFLEAPDGRERVAAWLLTDSSRRVAQLRRLDGKPWQGIGAKAKTVVAAGGDAAWPVGAASIGGKPFVALVEGGPDLLAAWHFAWWCNRANEIAPVAMLGSGQRIHPDALPAFKGKGVWTFPHADTAGANAAGRWAGQLHSAGALWVKPFDFAPYTLPGGRPVKDLNDLCAAVEMADEQEEISHV
jgi:hypothetical protein